MTLFSVIVPVYNTEQYVAQCIDSVLSQEFRDFELILVDDGSTDSSGIICDQYITGSNAIAVIHKPNGGVSEARNVGLTVARGNYVFFLDSDDFMTRDALSHLSAYIQSHPDADLITCPHIRIYANGQTEPRWLPSVSSDSPLPRHEFLSQIHSGTRGFWSPWENMFRLQVIQRHSIEFDTDLTLGEDVDFFYNFVRSAERFGFLDSPTVNYRADREGSALRTRSVEGLLDLLGVFRQNFYRSAAHEHDEWRRSCSYFANMYANTVFLISLATQAAPPTVSPKIQFDKTILHETKGIKYVAAKLGWRLFGYRFGSAALGLFRN